MKYESTEFSTADLYFAAYLLVAGVVMLRTDRTHGTKFLFVFDTSVSNIEELKTAWFTQTGKVPALAYANQIKTLKSAVHMA